MRHDANTPDIEVASGRNKTQLSLLIEMRYRATAMNSIMASLATSLMDRNELPGDPVTHGVG